MSALTPAEASDRFRQAPDRHIETGGGAVAYYKIGTGPDVVFSHGWPVSGATWRTLLPYLAPHVTCHVIDHLGTGQSRFDRSTHIGLASHVQALRDVVDELGLTDFGVVGHDSGGMIAREAFAGDDRVRGWGLVATEQPPKPSWRFNSFIRLRVVPGFPKIVAWAFRRKRLRRNMFIGGDLFADKGLIGGEFEEFFLRPLSDDPDRQWASGQFADHFDLKKFGELEGFHRKMTQPVALVWGEKDPFFPVERTRAMMPQFAGEVSLEVVPDAKLFVHEEFPEPSARALLTAIG
ncbi:MAG: alpha/beta hydrolase [Actinomycetota bacterium]